MTTAIGLARRPLIAGGLLLSVYLGLSLLNDPRGYLGTDTGGKVATLKAMERHGGLNPDLGYWAQEWDPQGRLHPLYYTSHIDGKWVNVTTLPALYLAYPLFRVGGYRGALLVPMLGSVLAAFAARALAWRLLGRHERRWADVAFWVTGLASPLAIYALDFWEHSLGVALMAWGTVLLVDVSQRRAGWKGALAGGLLFGAAATMRTEALIYGAVATATACGWLVWQGREQGAGRAVTLAAVSGVAVAVGLTVPLVGNYALELATIGDGLRNDRAVGTVQLAVASSGHSRFDEALLTFLSPGPVFGGASYLQGTAIVGLAAVTVASSSRSRKRSDQSLAMMAAAGVAAIYVIRFLDGLGFVPGLLVATPMAALGLTAVFRRGTEREVDTRLVAAVALLALPLVWGVQYTGGAAPQWAGRYILTSGMLIGVIGVVALPRLAGWLRAGAIGLAAAITCFGLLWLSVRSHDVADASSALARRPEPVLVSRVAHLAREGGWFLDRQRWLTADDAEEERLAATVLTSAGIDEFAVVELTETARLGVAHDFPGFTPGAVSRLRYFNDVDLQVTNYRRAHQEPAR